MKRGLDPNIALSAYASLVLPASTLALMPFLFAKLTEAEISMVFIALAASRLLASFDFGIVGVAIPRANGLLRTDPESVRPFVRHAVARFVGLFVVAAVGISVIVAAGVRLPGDGGSASSLTLLLLAALGAAAFQTMSLLNSVLYAAGRYVTIAVASSGGAVVYVAAIVLFLDRSRPEVVLLATVAQFVCVAAIGWTGVASVATTQNRPDLAETEHSVSQRIGNGQMQFIGVGGVAVAQAPTLIAGLFLGPAGVAAVGVGQQYGSVVRLAGTSLGGYFLARLSSAEIEASQRRAAEHLHLRWIAVCALGGVVAAALAGPLIGVWLGDDAPARAGICSALGAAVGAALVSTLVASSFYRTTGRLDREVRFVGALLVSCVATALVAWASTDAVALFVANAATVAIVATVFNLSLSAPRDRVTSRRRG